jgi:GT2 family glycosyltransferase
MGIGGPVYNGGELSRELLECLRPQTVEDFVVILPDNASTDRTGDICADFAARDTRFRYPAYRPGHRFLDEAPLINPNAVPLSPHALRLRSN